MASELEPLSDASDLFKDADKKEEIAMSRQNTEQIHKTLHFGPLQIERYFRLFFSGAFIFGSLLIMWFRKGYSPYINIAICMTLVQTLWLLQFLIIVLTVKHLHSIVVFRKIVPETLALVVPYNVKEYKHRIMSSISAMSSLRGSNLFYLLGQTSNIIFGMTFSAVSFKWFDINIRNTTGQYDREINMDAVGLGLLLVSSFGTSIITSWELDLKSKLSTWLHYLGAAFAFIAGPTAFAINQHFSGLSIALMCVTYVCLAVFGSVYAFAKPEYENNSVMVHRVSMFCIVVELIAVVDLGVCVILYIFCMENDRIL